jgi:hypothetical protein
MLGHCSAQCAARQHTASHMSCARACCGCRQLMLMVVVL